MAPKPTPGASVVSFSPLLASSQPSIIFFDEIDGLAPVRSVKQDQIHASVVSTLLALMDGLDSRGQVCADLTTLSKAKCAMIRLRCALLAGTVASCSCGWLHITSAPLFIPHRYPLLPCSLVVTVSFSFWRGGPGDVFSTLNCVEFIQRV